MKRFKKGKKSFVSNVPFISFIIGLYFISISVGVIIFVLYSIDKYKYQYGFSPKIEWIRKYDIRGKFNSFQQTSDGGYIMVGQVRQENGIYTDVYILKVDSLGERAWSKSIRGEGWEEGNSVCQINNDDFVILSEKQEVSGKKSSGVYLIGTNVSGDTTWTRFIRKIQGNSITRTIDGGFLIVGFYSMKDGLYIGKFNRKGETLWEKRYLTFGGGNDVNQTADDGYIIAGSIWPESTKNSDIGLLKTDSSGDSMWTRAYHGHRPDYAYSVQQTADGGYVVTGFSQSFNEELREEIFLTKTDSQGNNEWMKTFGGDNGYIGNAVIQTNDGGYAVAGSYGPFFGMCMKITRHGLRGYATDIYIMKTDNRGKLIWQKNLSKGVAYSVMQTEDNGFVLFGMSEGKGFLAKLKPEE